MYTTQSHMPEPEHGIILDILNIKYFPCDLPAQNRPA